jgi:hypothetical protein
LQEFAADAEANDPTNGDLSLGGEQNRYDIAKAAKASKCCII